MFTKLAEKIKSFVLGKNSSSRSNPFFKQTKKIYVWISGFKSNKNPSMAAGVGIYRWILYPLLMFFSALFNVWFIQFQIQVGMNQSLTERVQAASNFVINAFIPGSENHQALLNIFFILALFFLLLAITNRFWLAFILNNLVFIIFGIADNQKLLYRNESILPSDLSQLSNPLMIVNFIGIKAWQFFLLLLGLIIFISVLYLLCRRFDSRTKFAKWYFRLPIFLLSFAVLFSARNLYTPGTLPDRVAASLNDSPIPWDVNYDQRQNGAVYSFMRFFDNKIMDTPKGYSKETIDNLNSKYRKIASNINKQRTNYLNQQTVIYVLSESFSDPTRVPGTTVTPDPIPKIRNIKNNTTSGLMLSSGYGGGTANLEYQALTSMSLTNFLPTVTSPYVQVAASADYLPNVSNNWSIKNAIHPYFPATYNRSAVYRRMGFKKFYTLSNPKIRFDQHIDNNPYVSDEAAYNNVFWLLSKNNNPQFIQMPTMQNHLGYNNWYKNYSFDINSIYHRSDSENDNVKTYVQGAHLTDDATERFLSRLDKIKRPITVVWYGDHLPGIYDSEIENPDNLLSLHETDYFIYSNKASRSHNTKVNDNNSFTSPNYFQALAAQHMNVKISPFLALLTELREQLPATSVALAKSGSNVWSPKNNQNIYMNNSGQQISSEYLTRRQKKLLNDYRMIQYDIVRGKHYVKNDGFLKVPSK